MNKPNPHKTEETTMTGAKTPAGVTSYRNSQSGANDIGGEKVKRTNSNFADKSESEKVLRSEESGVIERGKESAHSKRDSIPEISNSKGG
jgi:hypothetical protein